MTPFRFLKIALVGLGLTVPSVSNAHSSSSYAGSVTQAEWSAFAESFVEENGRVVDNANDGISHSEGQGYGMILAWMAGDRETFARLWTFTRQELGVRNDGLFAWKWREGDRPRVQDVNNASDGDVLIAYALAAAGMEWGEDSYVEASSIIRYALMETMIRKAGNASLILPGEQGFDEGKEFIVNPSYWVQEAFTLFAEIDGDKRWSRLHDTLSPLLMSQSRNPVLAPEWVRVRGIRNVRPDPELGAGFGYNALRVPLYAVRDGEKRGKELREIVEQVTNAEGNLLILDGNGDVVETLDAPGYVALSRLSRCAILNEPKGEIPSFEPTDYYPSVIHLLSVSAARVKAPECMISSD